MSFSQWGTFTLNLSLYRTLQHFSTLTLHIFVSAVMEQYIFHHCLNFIKITSWYAQSFVTCLLLAQHEQPSKFIHISAESYSSLGFHFCGLSYYMTVSQHICTIFLWMIIRVILILLFWMMLMQPSPRLPTNSKIEIPLEWVSRRGIRAYRVGIQKGDHSLQSGCLEGRSQLTACVIVTSCIKPILKLSKQALLLLSILPQALPIFDFV